MNAKVTLAANKGELTNVDYDLLPTYASKMFIDPPMVVRGMQLEVLTARRLLVYDCNHKPQS